MQSSFQAIVRKKVDISAHSRTVTVAPGHYIVSITHDDLGNPDGVRLAPVDAAGRPTIRLTRAEYELLEGGQLLERR